MVAEGKSVQEPRAETEAKVMGKPYLLTFSPWLGSHTAQDHLPRTTHPGVALSTQGWVLPHQSAVKKMIQRHSHQPV